MAQPNLIPAAVLAGQNCGKAQGRQREQIRRLLREGYRQMAQLNLELAEEGLADVYLIDRREPAPDQP
ncbi:MAG: hypothetical protein AB1331_02830 [Bacillota bacterium]